MITREQICRFIEDARLNGLLTDEEEAIYRRMAEAKIEVDASTPTQEELRQGVMTVTLTMPRWMALEYGLLDEEEPK